MTILPDRLHVGARRLPGNPIIRPNMDGRMGSNINGPSLIRVPEWVESALGSYYLYFADHRGEYIRLAYADRLEGPWATHVPGTLQLAESGFPVSVSGAKAAELEQKARAAGFEHAAPPHIASPEVVLDEHRREVRMYFHGWKEDNTQVSRVALSRDGLCFMPRSEDLANSYLRVFSYRGWWYGMAMPGIFYRSRDGLTNFEPGPVLFTEDMRHSALLRLGERLLVFWSRVGDTPESILVSDIDISLDWTAWQVRDTQLVLEPTEVWEGGHLERRPSLRGPINAPARELRDPAVFEENGRYFLLYSCAGESGIGVAELELAPG